MCVFVMFLFIPNPLIMFFVWGEGGVQNVTYMLLFFLGGVDFCFNLKLLN